VLGRIETNFQSHIFLLISGDLFLQVVHEYVEGVVKFVRDGGDQHLHVDVFLSLLLKLNDFANVLQ